MADETTREEKALIYVVGLLDQAIEVGAVKGGRFRLDVAGKKYFEKLKSQKFRPTKDEIEAVYVLLNDPPDEVKKVISEKPRFKWFRKFLNWLCK